MNSLFKANIEHLLDQARTCSASGHYEVAIDHYTQILATHGEDAALYLLRAEVFANLCQFGRAADDARQAVALAPDNAAHYWLLGGYLLSDEITKSRPIIARNNKARFDEITRAYAIALEKDPTSAAAWMNLLEIHLLSARYDDAISCYGSCAPYITTAQLILIRSFLGCLAIVLDGDAAEQDDEEPLHDGSVRITSSCYRMGEITSLIDNLDHFTSDDDVKRKAKEIYALFLGHFDDAPRVRYQ